MPKNSYIDSQYFLWSMMMMMVGPKILPPLAGLPSLSMVHTSMTNQNFSLQPWTNCPCTPDVSSRDAFKCSQVFFITLLQCS